MVHYGLSGPPAAHSCTSWGWPAGAGTRPTHEIHVRGPAARTTPRQPSTMAVVSVWSGTLEAIRRLAGSALQSILRDGIMIGHGAETGGRGWVACARGGQPVVARCQWCGAHEEKRVHDGCKFFFGHGSITCMPFSARHPGCPCSPQSLGSSRRLDQRS